jgi:hypothetical protein
MMNMMMMVMMNHMQVTEGNDVPAGNDYGRQGP